jgi:vacuolar-type H+-ATPase subunit H
VADKVDEKINEIQMHQETVISDANQPLQVIRERELEISGRVLAAKRQADEIVAEARKKAADVVSTAEMEGGAGAADRDAAIRAEADRKATELRSDAEAEVARIQTLIEARRDEAVRLVLDAVTAF